MLTSDAFPAEDRWRKSAAAKTRVWRGRVKINEGKIESMLREGRRWGVGVTVQRGGPGRNLLAEEDGISRRRCQKRRTERRGWRT